MLLALLTALLAGLATSVGGLLAMNRRTLERRALAVALAFSAGAMILISMIQVIPLGVAYMEQDSEPRTAQLVVWLSFFVGIGLVMAVDRLLPDVLNPNEVSGLEGEITEDDTRSTRRLMRSGLLVALVLGLHNFPEGMATFFTTYQEPKVGLTLAVAVAIHNIPEGIAVAAPVFAATRSRRKALFWATLSGLTEPVGALVAAAVVTWLVPGSLFGVFYGMVGGMMVFLALDEMLPASWNYHTEKHQTIYGLLLGMAVMAMSFVLFA